MLVVMISKEVWEARRLLGEKEEALGVVVDSDGVSG